MTHAERAFRHIARNDLRNNFAPRSPSEIAQLCARKSIAESSRIRVLIQAYQDEWEQAVEQRWHLEKLRSEFARAIADELVQSPCSACEYHFNAAFAR